MTDSAPVTDRRDEIRAGEPFPESARQLLDANGNIVLETKGHPRVDALGRVLGPEAEPDLASAVAKAARFDPRKLPPYTGTDRVAYAASLVGLSTVVKGLRSRRQGRRPGGTTSGTPLPRSGWLPASPCMRWPTCWGTRTPRWC